MFADRRQLIRFAETQIARARVLRAIGTGLLAGSLLGAIVAWSVPSLALLLIAFGPGAAIVLMRLTSRPPDAARRLDERLHTHELFASTETACGDFASIVRDAADRRARETSAAEFRETALGPAGWTLRFATAALVIIVACWPRRVGLDEPLWPHTLPQMAGLSGGDASRGADAAEPQRRGERARAEMTESSAIASRRGDSDGGRHADNTGGSMSNDARPSRPPAVSGGVPILSGAGPAAGGGASANGAAGALPSSSNASTGHADLDAPLSRRDLAATADAMIRRREIPVATADVVRRYFSDRSD